MQVKNCVGWGAELVLGLRRACDKVRFRQQILRHCVQFLLFTCVDNK